MASSRNKPSDASLLKTREQVQEHVEQRLEAKEPHLTASAQAATGVASADAQQFLARLPERIAEGLETGLALPIADKVLDYIVDGLTTVIAAPNLEGGLVELIDLISSGRIGDILYKLDELRQKITSVPEPVELPHPSLPVFEIPLFVQPIPPDSPQRDQLLTLNGVIADTTVDSIKNAAADKTDPLELRSLVINEAFPGGTTQKRLAVVRSVIAGAGGSAHLRQYEDLSAAVLYEVYNGRELQEIDDLDEADIREFGRRTFKHVGVELYKHHIGDVIRKLGGTPKSVEVDGVYDLLTLKRVPLDARDFTTQVARALEVSRRDQQFYEFFQVDGVNVDAEFARELPASRRLRAIRFLNSIGLDPEKEEKDADWARIALGLTGASDGYQDALNLIGLGGPTANVPDLNFELNFPEFETDFSIGLTAGNIRGCADLYYIHQFDRIGVFRAVDELGARFFSPRRLDLGETETAAKLYRYVKLKAIRFPEADRRHIMVELFEASEDGRSIFKMLMGRMVEALIEYTQSRQAGEFFLSHGQNGHPSTPGKRSSVIRTIRNLQRYLSDVGGGIKLFLRAEAGAQLMECFDILNSADVQAYYGGANHSGMLGIIENLIEDLDGEAPPVDRGVTLAVYGRRLLQWLADNTANVSILTDTDLDQLADHVDQWLAAYRRPTMEPDWLEDDDAYYDEMDEDMLVDDAVRGTLDQEEMDILGEI